MANGNAAPLARRTQYRRRREAFLAARQYLADSSESGDDSERSEQSDEQERNADGRPIAPVAFPLQECEAHDNNSAAEISEGLSSPSSNASEDVQQIRENPPSREESDSDERLHEDDNQDAVNGRQQINFNFPPPQVDGLFQPNRVEGNPLCPCTTTTEGDVLLMCLALGIRHGISWVAMVDVLKMVNKLYGRKIINESKYYLFKDLEKGKDFTSVHMYCPTCEKHLGTRQQVYEEHMVQCQNCQENIKPFSKNSSYFVSVKTDEQFKEIMEKPEVANEVMTYRFNREKLEEDAYEDIYDGHLYKQMSEPGQPLSDPKNFSVTINTDGLALGTTSAQSAWPIFMHVNEVSYQNRKKTMVYAGMWVGKKQPNMNIFMKPFVEDLQRLAETGFTWKDSNGIETSSRVIPIVAVLDSGARYKFLNLSSFAGYMGCTFCYQRAVNTPVGRRFTVCLESAPLRTHESMINDMRIAHESRNCRNPKDRIHNGCKGFTPLVYLQPYLNLGSSVLVDYMHNGLLGVTRAHVYAFLETANAPYYIGDPDKRHVINQRLMHIRPPTSITRTPRKITHMKKFTASEWRSFLLFYSFVCFDGHLGHKYLEHFMLLSSAFYILLQSSISVNELQLVNTYLRRYVFLTEKLFGESAMTYNVHLLLHITKAVSDWGPVWAYSTFVFESENHHLNKMLSASGGRVASQLTRRYLTFRAYPNLCEQLASSDEPLLFIKSITGKRYAHFIQCNNTLLVGKSTEYLITNQDLECIRALHIECIDRLVISFTRMLYTKIRFTTEFYSNSKMNDDSWIKIKDGSRGFIKSILYFKTGDVSNIVIMLQVVNVDRLPSFRTQIVSMNHIKRITGLGNIVAIKPEAIVSQCIHIEVDNGNFIIDMPFGCYGD